MKSWLVPLIGGATLMAAAAAVFLWTSTTALRTPEEEAARELELVRGRCVGAESVDRWLLQQSWYYDQAFHNLAGAFGQSSFSWYKDGDLTQAATDGAFCISGSDLMVTYYERQFVPIGAKPSTLTVEFGMRLKPLGKDTYRVKELNEHRMVLVFESDGREHVFFRKN